MSKPSTRPSARRLGRRALAGLVVTGSLVGVAAGRGAVAAAAHVRSGLPAGWELCVIQGVGGRATGPNVADLDAWQVAEGGATQNGLAFNPFNTRRGTDQAGASLPASFTDTGFPAFANWASGCAATVATILQPNMALIATALSAGTLSPPTSFLTTVDQTPWCAPSDGVPCYADLIRGGLSLAGSQALALLHQAGSSLATYDSDVSKQAALDTALAADRQQLSAAQVEVGLSRWSVQQATQVLRSLAIFEYTSNPSLEHMAALLGKFHPPSQTDLLSQYYLGLDATAEVSQFKRAQTVMSQAEAAQSAAASAVDSASGALAAATAATGHALAAVGAQLRVLEDAGACSGPPSGSLPAPVATLRGCVTALTA